MSEAKRDNSGKPMLSFILQFPTACIAFAQVKTIGAIKYLRDNWKIGGKPDYEYLDAALRHIMAFMDGEMYASDTGCTHLGHAMWNIMALQELNYKGITHDPELFASMCEYWKNRRFAESKGVTDFPPVEVWMERNEGPGEEDGPWAEDFEERNKVPMQRINDGVRVGDINVNITGGEEVSGRQIARELKRELRKRTLLIDQVKKDEPVSGFKQKQAENKTAEILFDVGAGFKQTERKAAERLLKKIFDVDEPIEVDLEFTYEHLVDRDAFTATIPETDLDLMYQGAIMTTIEEKPFRGGYVPMNELPEAVRAEVQANMDRAFKEDIRKQQFNTLLESSEHKTFIKQKQDEAWREGEAQGISQGILIGEQKALAALSLAVNGAGSGPEEDDSWLEDDGSPLEDDGSPLENYYE